MAVDQVFRPPATDASVPVARLAPLVGSYRFGPNALIKISLQNGRHDQPRTLAAGR
jgi:hypothetical protein